MTHKDMVKIVLADCIKRGWVAMDEPVKRFGRRGVCEGLEIPDVISWDDRNDCHVFECKVELGDWFKDAQKKHGCQLGNYRTYCVPPHLIESYQAEQRGHGLTYVADGMIQPVTSAPYRRVADRSEEIGIMAACLRHYQNTTGRRPADARPSRQNWKLTSDQAAEVEALVNQGITNIVELATNVGCKRNGLISDITAGRFGRDWNLEGRPGERSVKQLKGQAK